MNRLPLPALLAWLPPMLLGGLAAAPGGPPAAQKAEGRRQKAESSQVPACLLPSAFCLLPSEQAAEPAPSAKPDFARDVRPLLNRYCNGCHSAAKRKGNLSLEGFADEA